ncbi:MAG: amidohydrolase family protein [Acidimicrobiales bacterium]
MHQLISADGHLNEPGDLWTSRVPASYRDRVPRIERFDDGDAWVMEGAPPRPFGWGACAGKPPNEMFEWARFEDINPGSYDAKARVAEMEADGVDAEVIYPSGGPVQFATGTTDPDFHLAMVQAYNDFLAEFCAYAPHRLGGAAVLPNRGVAQAIAEVERLGNAPGIVAWLLRCYPHGTTEIDEADDELWAAIEDSGKPITIHVALSGALPGRIAARRLPGTVHFYDAPGRMLELIFSGVLDRFPRLRFAMAEVDCGWVPYFAEQADDNYLRHRHSSLKDVALSRLPSEYIHDFFWMSFITDTYAVANRQRVGVDRMLWSNDYPHITSDWPHSWKTIKATFADVPADERHAILAGNSEALFGFGT